ncbi:MAG TPA: sigma-E factor negative regulatory protein [Gallionella sp.]
MKQEISALMDGELFEDEVDHLLDQLKQDPRARKNWAAYHLIRDALRQPEHIHCDLSARVRERVKEEPTVFVPRGHAEKQRIRAFALSAVASLAAVGVVTWMSLQVGPEDMPQMAMQQQSMIRAAKAEAQTRSNDYLMAHQAFSPSTDMSGGAYYIRTVSYRADENPTRTNPGK